MRRSSPPIARAGIVKLSPMTIGVVAPTAAATGAGAAAGRVPAHAAAAVAARSAAAAVVRRVVVRVGIASARHRAAPQHRQLVAEGELGLPLPAPAAQLQERGV